VDPVEDGGRHEVDPADADVALALAGLPAADAGVPSTHRSAPGPHVQVGAHAVHALAQHGLVAAGRAAVPSAQAELETGDLGLQGGKPVDRDVALLGGSQ